jgi:hypothetical protein
MLGDIFLFLSYNYFLNLLFTGHTVQDTTEKWIASNSSRCKKRKEKENREKNVFNNRLK